MSEDHRDAITPPPPPPPPTPKPSELAKKIARGEVDPPSVTKKWGWKEVFETFKKKNRRP